MVNASVVKTLQASLLTALPRSLFMMCIPQNDLIIPRDETVVDIEDRGYQFGDGVYQVIRPYEGRSFRMADPLVRLGRSAQELGMDLDFTDDVFKVRLNELISQSSAGTSVLYIQVTRGIYTGIQEFPPADLPVPVTAYVRDMPRPREKLETVTVDRSKAESTH